MKENKIWTSIRDIIGNISSDQKNEYKELWIPGFNVEASNSDMLQNMVGGTINGKYIESVRMQITL
jgi:hypothetical protein